MRIGTAARWMTVLAAAAITLTACGPMQLGAAAIYSGNQRITTAQLTAQAANLNANYQADQKILQGVPAALQYPGSEIPRKSLSWMLSFAIQDSIAAREHITVTRADVQAGIGLLTGIAHQDGLKSLSELAVVYGIPPDLLQALGRYQAINTKLVAKVSHGVKPTTQAQVNAVNAVLQLKQCRAAKSMRISVNPQYGALDYVLLAVKPTASVLTAPSGGNVLKPPSAKQFQPSC